MENKYPKNITLVKLNTLENAEYPQREKYPEGTSMRGLMWEYSLPEVDEQFYVLESKLFPVFETSIVTKIIESNNKEIIFETINSTYKIIIE